MNLFVFPKYLLMRWFCYCLMDSKRVVVLDLETTGLSPYRHKITEVAAVKVQNGKVVDSFQTLVDPETPIPRFITKLTGITDEMVSGKPKIKDVIPKLKNFLGEDPIVGHNVSFDYNFLRHNFSEYCSDNLQNPLICTAKLARRILPDLSNKKLGTVAEYYGVVNERAHRAMADVKATKEIYYKFIDELKQKKIDEFNDLIKFQQLSKDRAQKWLSANNAD